MNPQLEKYASFGDIFTVDDFLFQYDSMLGFGSEEELESWIESLLDKRGLSMYNVVGFLDDYVDNPKIVLEDGTVLAIDGRYGEDYLVDITSFYDEDEEY